MTNPERRIHLYPVGACDVEILILGEPENIAPLVAEISGHLTHWIGFSSMRMLTMGAQVIGFRATRDENATHADALAEAILMLRKQQIAWADGGPRCGLVGTW